MPEQAILDLPVIEFELYADSMGRLHAQCIESYGLAGFRPHPDAVFHFTASLWRYREEETLKQVVGLSSFYLHALSRHVAARRRVAAVRTAMEEQGAANVRSRLAKADEELGYAQEDLTDITVQVAEFVKNYSRLRERAPKAARARMTENLEAMGDAGWGKQLEALASGFGKVENARIDWSAPWDEVAEDLEAVNLPEGTNGNGHGHETVDGKVLQRLNAELEQYRTLAGKASSRLQEVDKERHELEELLAEREGGESATARALNEARETLEGLVSGTRQRLERMERAHEAQLSEALREIGKLKAERDRLAEELLHTLDTSTDTESSEEELIDKLEMASGDRMEAAQALSALSRRLEEVQGEADETALQSESLKVHTAELEQSLDELREELSRAEQRNQQAQATIKALESNSGRSAEIDTILTESEAKLADTQEKLADAELRADQLAGQLEDKAYELQRALERFEGQKKTIDSISGQLAESEALADGHEARITGLEKENERLRRDLSDAQSRMLDAKGDVEEARDQAQTAKAELQRIKDRLDEERGKTTSMSRETVELRNTLRDREDDLKAIKAEFDTLQSRLKKTDRISDEQAKKARDLHNEVEKQRQMTSAAIRESAKLREEIKQAREDAAAKRSESEGLAREKTASSAAFDKLQIELEALRAGQQQGGSQSAELRARSVELEQQLAAQRLEQEAARDLAEDRRRKIEERLTLAAERARNAESEARTALDALAASERARKAERDEALAVIEKGTGKVAGEQAAMQKAQEEANALRQKLNESEAFLIKRQREFERAENQLTGLLNEIKAIADLRTKFEKTKPGKKHDELASQIGRRIDSLFAAAGKPIRADRKTEKILILTVRKTDAELAEEESKPFVATNKGEDSSGDESSET